MDLPVLVDSNVYIDLLRKRLDPAEELPAQISRLDLVVCGMVRVEVLRGIRVAPIRAQMRAFFDVLQNVPTDNHLWGRPPSLPGRWIAKASSFPRRTS
jgi:predicted nucleic acid-binding protein